MEPSSRSEIKTHCLNITRQTSAQIGDLVNEFINLTLQEIETPGWAFRNNSDHKWSFLRRKTTFSSTADTENYVLTRAIDTIALIRQTNSPTKIHQITDELFYKLVPNPTEKGNPNFYRLWETEGVSTRLTEADTIDVVSSSASDAGDSALTVSVMGYDSNGIWRVATYQLNGTTAVTGSITFATNSEIFISKQKDTTGSITVRENSGSTTLVVIGPQERSPRFKVLSLYPIPSSAITIYVEYFRTIPSLENDSDVPLIPYKFINVLIIGVVSKIYQYLNKEDIYLSTRALFGSMVKSMVAADTTNPDLVEEMERRTPLQSFIRQQRSEDAVS